MGSISVIKYIFCDTLVSDSVCAKLREAASNLDLCTVFGSAAPCVGDIAGGEICQCPSTHNGVLCEDAGAPGGG